MAIGDAVGAYRKDNGLSQSEIATRLHFDRSYISRIESGEREVPEEHDSKFASLHWTVAAKIGEERTGGYFINPVGKLPTDIDRHYAVTGLMLEKETMEFLEALRNLIAFRHSDPNVRQERADQLWLEMRDMEVFASLMRGHLEDDFGVDRAALIKRHEYEFKNGKR